MTQQSDPWLEVLARFGTELADIDPRIGFTPTGLVLPDDLGEDKWQRVGTVLHAYAPLLDPDFVRNCKMSSRRDTNKPPPNRQSDDKVRERKPPRPGSRKAAVYECYRAKGYHPACNLAHELGIKIGTAHSWCNEWSKS